MGKKISIEESEYREYIRLKVTNDELEKITQKRIDDAVATAVNAKNKEWQERYDKTIEGLEKDGAVRVVKDADSFCFIDRTTTLISSKNNDLSELIDKFGLGSIIEYQERFIRGEDTHYLEYNGTRFYASDGLKTLEKDIERTARKLNKIKDKMIAIRGLDPSIFDAMTHRGDASKINVKEQVKTKSKSWLRKMLNN